MVHHLPIFNSNIPKIGRFLLHAYFTVLRVCKKTETSVKNEALSARYYFQTTVLLLWPTFGYCLTQI